MAKFFAFLLAGLTFIPAAAAVSSDPSDPGAEFFEKKIRPVLAEHCHKCHSHKAEKLKAGLYLDSRDGFLKGGDTGVAVALGEPDKSRLIEALRYKNPDLEMPPKEKLPDEVIADFVEWVKMGIPWPKEEAVASSISTENARETERRKQEHWAWQPVSPGDPPTVQNTNWPQNGIDRFVLAGLEKKRLTPVSSADRRTLIRRAYFDLIGLPPTAREIAAFESDGSPDAFARVVDSLLANPHYGERWGRHWLDVARYGEDQAHSFKPRLYPQGFRYRDWLVRAFNADMPYDRFIQEQIAADLLDAPDRTNHLAALGFFALGPVYYGDGKMFDQFDDRVDTVSRGFLALTVACARCHDHKFDPISTKDYYALSGIIASSEYVETPLASPEKVQAYDKAQAAVQAKTKELDDFIKKETTRLADAQLEKTVTYLMAGWRLEQQRRSDPKMTVKEIAHGEGVREIFLQRWMDYLAKPVKEQLPQLAKWNARRTELDAESTADLQELERETRKAADGFQDYLTSAVKLRDAVENHKTATAKVSSEKLEKLSLDESSAAALSALTGKDGIYTVPKDRIADVLSDSDKAQLASLRTELERLKRESPEKYPFVHSLQEGTPKNLPVLLRGNASNPGAEVPRRFLSIFGGESRPAFTNGSGRLDLALAIADKKNPITARVMVNRVWQHLFGTGLVRTHSNFGTLGELPTHPELLDYLAHQFMESGWSVKSLTRTIMLSSTYQMSSRDDAHNQTVDADNKSLWRMNRRRLEVEAWRDAMLAVSGELDPAIGGESKDLSPENRRRTFYAKVSRHNLNSLLRLFDFPDPNVTSDARTVTTVPLQQLFFLNSEFMVRQARTLAAKFTAASDESDSQRIVKAYLLVYGRPPTAEEIQMGQEFLASAMESPEGKGESLSRWDQYAQVLLSANEFLFVD
jgi:cytochrome c553